jgi:hypothetical protein
VILAALALAVAPAPADVLGLGTKSCGNWTAAAREDGWPRIAYHAWLGGFISGINLNISGTNGNLNEGTDFAGMAAWVDNYCVAHPLDNVDSAAVSLAIEILNKKKPR